MCGRFESLTLEDLEEVLKTSTSIIDMQALKFGETYPTEGSVVFTSDGEQIMSWGAPKWDGKGSVINARQESLLSKSYFYQDFLMHRCVVPVTAFYEWDIDKNQYLVDKANQKGLKMAGLYKIVDKVPYFIIITQPATSAFEEIHDRLPLLLEDDEVELYLQSKELERWTKPRPPKGLQWKLVKLAKRNYKKEMMENRLF